VLRGCAPARRYGGLRPLVPRWGLAPDPTGLPPRPADVPGPSTGPSGGSRRARLGSKAASATSRARPGRAPAGQGPSLGSRPRGGSAPPLGRSGTRWPSGPPAAFGKLGGKRTLTLVMFGSFCGKRTLTPRIRVSPPYVPEIVERAVYLKSENTIDSDTQLPLYFYSDPYFAEFISSFQELPFVWQAKFLLGTG